MLDAQKKQAGFTLVDVLIVDVILALLATLGLGSFRSAQSKSRDARRKADLQSMQAALEMYINDKGQYPLSDANGNILGCGEDGALTCGWGGSWEDGLGTVYMTELPADPYTGQYFYDSDGVSYRVYARLENEKDKDIPTGAQGEAQRYTTPGSSGCLAGGCNYGKPSSNTTLGTTETDS